MEPEPAPAPKPAAKPAAKAKPAPRAAAVNTQQVTNIATEVAERVAAEAVAKALADAEAAKQAAEEAAVAEAAPAEEAPKAPVYNEGNVSWMLTATAFVLLMSIPGLALFYGGMVRTKNMLSTLMQIFTIFCVISILWVIYGYSVAFSNGNPFFGGFSKLLLAGVVYDANGFFVPTATFSKGVLIPELIFAMFQLTFAAITVCLVAGGFAERMKFSAVLLFSVIWFTFSYLPMAHMVWWWPGPDAYTSAEVVAEMNATAGWLWQMGALDFAGGTVVHINAGVAGLVAALFVGKRLGYGKIPMPPHSLTMSMLGASLLWFGWFGFNAGSNLEANGYAVLAFANTLFATAVAAVTWLLAEWIVKGKPSLLGIISGAVAGLVGITPACGFVGIEGALVIGLSAGLLCFVAVTFIKKMLGYDDALDAFGVHAIGGMVGAILTGVFVNPKLGGAGYVTDGWLVPTFGYDSAQIMIQVKAAAVAAVWSAVVSSVALLLIKFTIGLRPSEESEREGLDIAEHGETAYNY
ncbi:MAG: ammonium transporter [Nevskiales bacterium]